MLAAYIHVVVLPNQATPAVAAAAERHLLAALGALQQAVAAQGLLRAAAQQAAAAAAGQLHLGSSFRGAAQERHALLAESLQHLTSPAALEAAAAAQLLVRRMHQLGAVTPADGQKQVQEHDPQAAALAGLLHSPPSQLELELLCYMALLPSWEAMLARLAGLAAPPDQQCSRGGSHGAAKHAVEQLCGACREQPDAVLALHPALPAEVCRVSLRFAAAYAPLLEAHLAAAMDDTRSAAAAARLRAAHATKHADPASDYLQAKLCALPRQ